MIRVILLTLAVLGMLPKVFAETRVMSFNIRYGTAADGENHWDHRKELVIETIRQFAPDLLGTQETMIFQRDFLAEQLADYEVVGVGRNDGKVDGETVSLLYFRQRYDLLDQGHFWLSATPEIAGSQGWDAALPRMATWVKLHDRTNPKSSPILFVNTHFDHRGLVARQKSSLLLRQYLQSLGEGCRLVLTGDFNSEENSVAYKNLFAPNDSGDSPIRDTLRIAHPTRLAREGTFSNFVLDQQDGPRIDWIGASASWKIISAGIDHTANGKRVPSDHFPVTAVLDE